ncbi:sulfite exporter TauE/SafE family protein [Pseudorhodoferax sp. Leaf267]|uniref:sulfite exporter TauE/SafE family protein n=1 Tax=Pseudorhodoferax sp. Leaf267 TaxID=1736316 RepID=UPI001F4259E2|nr:sulfite exporter TauE/SafE family protein [Pseudorhodoferax sp. Leaf267]
MTALLMGLAGGPHCALMCGAACAGVGAAGAPRRRQAMGLFHAGRACGYAAMGSLAAWSLQGLGWLGGASAALRPAWTGMHLLAMALGAWLLLQGRQPAWLEREGRRLWQRARAGLALRGGPFWLGLAWALMPCGLLQAALLTAALTGHPANGAAAMLAFAAGSAVSLWAAPWLLLRLPAWAGAGPRGMAGARSAALSAWGTRAVGAALCASACWALWQGLAHDRAPWCIT